MLVRTLFCVVLLSPSVLLSVEPPTRSDDSRERLHARELLRAKMTEAAKLHAEIDRLRQSAGEPPSNIRLRVRLVEVSLTKIANTGVALPGLALLGESDEGVDFAERQLNLLVEKGIARVRADENLTVAEGGSARMHAGDELASSAGETPAFDGDELAITASTNDSGQLTIEFDYTHRRPIVKSDQPPQQHVHLVQTTFELKRGRAVVLDGAKEKRVEMSMHGAFPRVGRGRVTESTNEIQTFVMITRADEVAATPVKTR